MPPLTRPQVTDLRAQLDALAAQLDAGTLDATPRVRAMVAGALAALAAVQGDRATLDALIADAE